MKPVARFRNYLDLFRYHRERSAVFAEHDFRNVFEAPRRRVAPVLERPLDGSRLLDIGCGQRCPATLLFTHSGCRVTGIDTELVTPGAGAGAFLRIWRDGGFERAAKTLFRQLVFDPPYYRELERHFGARLPRRGLDVRQLSITERMPYDDATFDVVISNAVFEHIADVPAAVRELTRLLAPGGVCHIAIHLFPSLSGGHHMRWAFPEIDPPADIPPWDHLRERRFPTHVYLNELTYNDYRAAFARQPGLEVVEWVVAATEGARFLTPEIEAELGARYSRDDLLTREVVVVARRRGEG